MDQIRTLKQEELIVSMILSEFAFQYQLTEEEREERLQWQKADGTWGYFVEDKLAAKLAVLDLRTWIHGKSFAMGGIAGVATWPEYRRKGMVGQLLVQSLKAMKEAGQSISYLFPFAYSFYRKYGWESLADHLKYEITVQQLPKFNLPKGGQLERVETKAELLQGVYDRYAKSFNGMLNRDDAWWKNRIFKNKKGTVVLYRNASGEAEGYVFYEVKDRVLTVHELVYVNESARAGLWKLIADHDSMIDKVVLKAPVDDQLAFMLPDPRIKKETIAYFTARVVDVEAFIQQYPFAPAESIDPFYLQIADQHAAWNHAIFEVTLAASGEASVKKIGDLQELSASAAAKVLSCDIGVLSTLLVGYQSASFLHTIGRLQGDAGEVNRLERSIPIATTYITDFF